jgi:ubiquinone/menaquinone biosynthesis C-methylase UbiE
MVECLDQIDLHKEQAQKQWNANPCGASDGDGACEKGSLEFFDSVRKSRYEVSDTWMKKKIPFSTGKDKKLLEIGFGMGSDLLTWCESGAEVHGIDITPEHFRLAQANFALHGQKADLKLADASDIPYPSNSFDIVYSNGVLHHTPDTVRCISEAYRVLKPGGQLIFTMYHFYSAFHFFDKLLFQGLCQGKLFTLGYHGLMSTTEKMADGINIKPLVKTYSKRQLKTMLADFSTVKFEIALFNRGHIPIVGRFIPPFLENFIARWIGWYIVAYATK